MTQPLTSLEQIKRTRQLLEQIENDEHMLTDPEIVEFLNQPLDEDSTLLKQFGKDTRGRMLAKYLHAQERISNRAGLRDADLSKTTFEWKNFKVDPDNFLIIQGRDGWAAVRPDPREVEAAKKSAKTRGQDVGNKNWITYQVFYVVEADDGVKVAIHRSTRGGMVRKKDPRGVALSDFVAELVGRPFQSAYFLDERDPGDVDAARLSGGRSRNYPPQNPASVERSKISARAKKYKQPPAVHQLATKIWPILPTLLKHARRYARSSGSDSTVGTIERISNMIANHTWDSYDRSFDILDKLPLMRAMDLGIEAVTGEANDKNTLEVLKNPSLLSQFFTAFIKSFK